MNTARAHKLDYSYQLGQGSYAEENSTLYTEVTEEDYSKYVQNPIEETPIIEGYFYKESTVKDMAIRKVNKSLCGLLVMAILTTFVSYYFVMCNELTLNTLNRQIISLNDENTELQNNLDRLKSFNNVDNKMMQYNLLQKAEKVIEVPAVVPTQTVDKTKIASAPFKWAIGY